ncbi:MAG: carbohydrate kinase family protein [Atopobiaceae bacterium]|jgi:sugar/nucleoside kinase (ribokinase family)
MGCEVITSGYVSMDHVLKIKTPARVGYTSLISNTSCTTIYPGGCSVNIAYGLSKLGISAMPVLRVGGDWEAVGLKSFLEEAGVSTEGITVLPDETTSTSFLVEDSQGEHITLFYPGSMDAHHFQPLSDNLFHGVRYGVITVASLPDNKEFFTKCRLFDIPIVFGMKGDANAFPHDFLWEILIHSDIIFTNESERTSIEYEFGLKSLEDLLEIGEASILVTTYGVRGSAYWAREGDQRIHGCVPCCDCTAVVDTTGGGDAYMAGFLYGRIKGFDLSACCQMGSTLSSFVLEKEGCCTGMPHIEEFMRRYEAFDKCEVK